MRLFSDKTLDQEWWIANAWDAASRWAVPIYIMLSGALLLDPSRKELPSTFYRKRLGRLGVPLVFWTAFFMWFGVQYTKAVSYQTPDGVKVTGVTAAWYLLAMGKPYVHLHFIFRIAGLYLFTPMMRIWLANTPRKMQWVGVIAVLSLSGADSVMNALTRTEPSVFARFVPFIGYYLLGYMLRDTVVSKRGMIYCWVGFIVTYLILMLGTGWTVWRYHKTGSQLIGPPSMEMLQYDFLSPTRIVMTICVWLIFVRLFRHPWPKSERGRKIFGWWASTTLGIYLIHPMFRDIFDCQRKWIPFTSYDTFMFHPYKATYPNIWIGIPLTVFMVYFWSLVVIAILMKIPLIRRIAG